MVCHLQSKAAAADYWLWSSRYYNSREPTWLRSVIASIPCGLEQEKLNWMEVSCKTTEKPKFPYNRGRCHSPFITISAYPHCIEYPLHQERVGKSQNLSSILASYSFPFLRCFMAIIKILDGPRDGGVRGAGGRKVFAHGWVLCVWINIFNVRRLLQKRMK